MSPTKLISANAHSQQHTETNPPATNRGVENPLHERIDWISFTLGRDILDVWPHQLDTVSTESKSFNGYDTAREYSDGRIELTSTTRPDMGIHCVLSGTTCSNLADELHGILEHCWLQGGRVTRIDFALDDDMGRISPRIANEYLLKGQVNCRAKQTPFYSDPRQPGETQYFGRMASETMVRIYDKDAEQKVYGFRTRIEIKFSGKKADKAAKTYLRVGDSRGLILGYIKFPAWDIFNKLFAVKPERVPAEKVESKRVRWLLQQVAKSMALEIFERNNDWILTRFEEKVRDNLSDLKHKKSVGEDEED